ncbi:hypothetical protein [Phytohabitans houttuyneae]|uniref:hypothetical protein n=1 Tax=Phytohabitans houttuyneae TaxID=1076126 RepID=UPI001C49A96A|nr:hypothetical protein [Phytohabitans houttuyneae]
MRGLPSAGRIGQHHDLLDTRGRLVVQHPSLAVGQQALPQLLQPLVAASPRPLLVGGLGVDGKFPTSHRRQLASGL